MLWIFLIYRPFMIVAAMSVIGALPGIALMARYAYYFYNGEGGGHLHSVVVAIG